jgi:RimJ/RimL family protein N-acetyltransferase
MDFKFSKIETNRIILRFLKKDDAEDMLIYRNNIDVSKYQGFEPTYSKDTIIEFINNHSTDSINPKESWIQIGIEYKQNNKIIGDIGIHVENIGCEYYQAQLGITLNPAYQSKGIAYEAINIIINFLFNYWNCHRIYVEIDTRNNKSVNLFKKLKFREEAHLINNYFFKNEWTSIFVYAILKDE